MPASSVLGHRDWHLQPFSRSFEGPRRQRACVSIAPDVAAAQRARPNLGDQIRGHQERRGHSGASTIAADAPVGRILTMAADEALPATVISEHGQPDRRRRGVRDRLTEMQPFSSRAISSLSCLIGASMVPDAVAPIDRSWGVATISSSRPAEPRRLLTPSRTWRSMSPSVAEGPGPQQGSVAP